MRQPAANKDKIRFILILRTASFLGFSAEEGKRKWGRVEEADWRGEGRRCCGAVGRLGEFLVWGRFGGSSSPLRRLSIGLVTPLSRFCRGEGGFVGVGKLFPKHFCRDNVSHNSLTFRRGQQF